VKKIIWIVIALAILSACSSRLKKIVPDPTPIQDGNNGVSKSEQLNEAESGAETVAVDGKAIVKNPDSLLVLANKTRYLPSDYVPGDLIIPKVAFPFKGDLPQMYMRKEAADALADLFNEALKDGIKLFAVSGYRSYNTQQRIYNNEVRQAGSADAANKAVALPGQSEHQTGLSMDVSCAGANYILVESFENTKEGIWLKEHAKDAGFIIRYPKDKTDITKYEYEPWHIRYVGKEAADYIVSHDIALDQYYSTLSKK
jgi:LAS superfamily LD-carboxypeptidase LdcB